jgi:hypothetical protein
MRVYNLKEYPELDIEVRKVRQECDRSYESLMKLRNMVEVAEAELDLLSDKQWELIKSGLPKEDSDSVIKVDDSGEDLIVEFLDEEEASVELFNPIIDLLKHIKEEKG